MKILFLNPLIDAEHQLVQALRRRGDAVLFVENAKEAAQILQLHGDTIELAIIHREGTNDPDVGIKLIDRIKRDPAQTDLPIILSTAKWTDAQCAEHQKTPLGANAYLTSPFTENQLLTTLAAIFGDTQEPARTPAPAQTQAQISTPPAPPPPSDESSMLQISPFGALESTSEVLNEKRETSSILLEAPSISASLGMPSAAPAGPELGNTNAIAFPTSDQGTGPAITLQIGGVDEHALTAFEIESPPIISAATRSAFFARPAEPPAPSAPEETGITFGMPALPEAPPTHTQTQVRAEAEPSFEIDPTRAPEAELPYLFGEKKAPPAPRPADPAAIFAQPVGDAIVPGGAANAPDVETLKKYLLLREQDVAALSSQLKSARERIETLEAGTKHEQGRALELGHVCEEQKRRIDSFDKEKELALDAVRAECEELSFQVKAKTDKARVLEAQVREATGEIEKLKERVRADIRKIRVREKELENKLEIARKDAEALLGAREAKIIELKRKLDLLEFNMDLLQDQYSREKETTAKLRSQLARAAQVVRVAGGLLDGPGGPREASGSEDTTGTETKAS